MTLKNAKKWYKAFKANGREAEAEELQAKYSEALGETKEEKVETKSKKSK